MNDSKLKMEVGEKLTDRYGNERTVVYINEEAKQFVIKLRQPGSTIKLVVFNMSDLKELNKGNE